MLEIKDLHVSVSGKEILKEIDMFIPAGEVHAIMGPNGSGKTTFAHVLAGHPGYVVTKGNITFKGRNLLEMTPEQRAVAGIFLAFQYPVEIPGVSNITFLKTAFNSVRKAAGKPELDTLEIMELLREKAEVLGINDDMLRRAVNTGFSGGEKKRNEMLQMILLEPVLCILDETDSGLDIDALKIVTKSINALRSPERSMIVITHYQRLLDYFKPDCVHILAEGRFQKSGGQELVLQLEKDGYAAIGNARRATA